MGSTLTVQSIVNSARAYPDLVPVLGTAGWTQEPALTIANDVMQKILAQNFDWKWNRAYLPSMLTVALQQDYVTNITDVGWLEGAWRVDINNSTNNGNLAPKPIFTMESVRDIGQTSTQSNPFNVSTIPNTLAFMGQWFPNTAYSCGYGLAQTPQSPVQQFIDANGNILFINSTNLGLNINSPGFTGTPIGLPPGNPYGISGGTRPVLPANSTPGTTVTDGTVTWTVADPNGYAIRLAPLPPLSGLVWLIVPVYQKKPPILTSLQQIIRPIPDEYGYLFRSGFIAMCKVHASAKDAIAMKQDWEEQLWTSLRGADREREDASFYPSEGLTGGGPMRYGMPVGPAFPYDFTGF